MAVTPAAVRWRVGEHLEFHISLSYVVRSCIKERKEREKGGRKERREEKKSVPPPPLPPHFEKRGIGVEDHTYNPSILRQKDGELKAAWL